MLTSGSLIFNRYQIIHHLGSGGMGDVYLVQDTLLNNQQVALKLLRSDFLAKDGSKERFLREVELARQATHSNVLRTFDVGEDPVYGIYFTMEYANGSTLAKLLENGAIKYQQVLLIIQQLLSGLVEIHQSNIIHRDLKPSNIIINHDGQVQIMDFGIARSGDSQLTTTSEVLGSGPYMSPEQWKGGTITAKTDLYCVGVILFELLTGIQPFHAETAPQQMYKHLVELPQLKSCKADLPNWINQLTITLLAKDPADRPNSANEVLQLIEDKIYVEKIYSGYQLGAGGTKLIFEARGAEDCFKKVVKQKAYWSKVTGLSLALLTLMSMGFVGKSFLGNSFEANKKPTPTSRKIESSTNPSGISEENSGKLSKSTTKNVEPINNFTFKEDSTKSSGTKGTYNKVKFKTTEKFPVKDEKYNSKTKAELQAQKNQSTNAIASKLKLRLQQMTPEERQKFFKK